MFDERDIQDAIVYIIKTIFIVFFINIIVFYLGFLFLKTITLWKYPSVQLDQLNNKDKNIILGTGMLLVIAVFAGFFVVNNNII
jgi:small-conductance mechanosensitive channel